jgi:hypothetical protein
MAKFLGLPKSSHKTETLESCNFRKFNQMEHDKAFSYSSHQERFLKSYQDPQLNIKILLQMGRSCIESLNDCQGWKTTLYSKIQIPKWKFILGIFEN